MHCPFCDAEKESLKVIDSRTCDGGRAIRRRRQCLGCKKRFTTYEKIEQNVRLSVIKKDGRRVPWDPKKLYIGLERASFKRPVSQTDLQALVDEVEEEIFRTHDREVPSSVIGQMVSDRLRRIDQVSYVRYASVYRQFKTLDDLVNEAKAVIDARRFEDPSQGRLFVDPAAPAPSAPVHSDLATPENGHPRDPKPPGTSRTRSPRRSQAAPA